MKLKRVRGGTWFSYVRHARCAFRHGVNPGRRLDLLGFRCFSPFFVIKRKVRK